MIAYGPIKMFYGLKHLRLGIFLSITSLKFLVQLNPQLHGMHSTKAKIFFYLASKENREYKYLHFGLISGFF